MLYSANAASEMERSGNALRHSQQREEQTDTGVGGAESSCGIRSSAKSTVYNKVII